MAHVCVGTPHQTRMVSVRVSSDASQLGRAKENVEATLDVRDRKVKDLG